LLISPFATAQTKAAPAQPKSKVELQTSETIFSVMTAINACGYDAELANSDPLRADVRARVNEIVTASSAADAAKSALCAFYNDHRTGDATRDVSQYVSLALNLGPAPDFQPRVKEADLPPDSAYVLGFVPLLAKFYAAAGLNKIWNEVQPRYDKIIDGVNEPLANMILTTDVYLKNPITGYTGHDFIIYIEPMTGPGQVNARNYGESYYLVTSPSNGKLPMAQIQHTYLHFMLDSLALKRAAAMKRLEPILKDIQFAPLEDSYKNDAALLLTESMIRAIEARLIPGGKSAEPQRQKEVARDMSDGFVFTDYFYDAMVKFEQEPTSLKDAFPDWLYSMDIGHQHKIAQETKFSTEARGEVVKAKATVAEKKQALSLIQQAKQQMSEHDIDGAEKLAQQVVTANSPDTPEAYYLLGTISTLKLDKENAIKYFELTLRNAKDPRLIAWSHIYLGRIYDVDQERDMAVKHYQAALRSGDDAPQTVAAAKRGLKSPYERRTSSEDKQ
jgi:tetratricopeptide (TPR) repeat protein